MSSSNSSSQKKSTDPELATQFKFLEDTLKDASSTDDGAVDNLEELLKQLDDAGDIAQGVEDKLDKLLGDLEEMIGKLEENKVPHSQDQKPG